MQINKTSNHSGHFSFQPTVDNLSGTLPATVAPVKGNMIVIKNETGVKPNGGTQRPPTKDYERPKTSNE